MYGVDSGIMWVGKRSAFRILFSVILSFIGKRSTSDSEQDLKSYQSRSAEEVRLQSAFSAGGYQFFLSHGVKGWKRQNGGA